MMLTPAKLAHVGLNKRMGVDAGVFTVMVGASSRDVDLTVAKLVVR